VVAAAAALAVLGAATASAGRPQQHERTIHFLLRPAASVSTHDYAGALDELKSDGALVPTIAGVLGSDGMLKRAASDAGIPFRSDYSLGATVRPGTALIDATVAAPGDALADRLSAGYTHAATTFVDQSYSAYVLDPVSSDSGGIGTGSSSGQVLILALLVGAALGVGLVAAELRFEPQVQTVLARTRRARAERAAKPAVNGKRRLPQPALRVLKSLGVHPAKPAPPREAQPPPAARPEPVRDEGAAASEAPTAEQRPVRAARARSTAAKAPKPRNTRSAGAKSARSTSAARSNSSGRAKAANAATPAEVPARAKAADAATPAEPAAAPETATGDEPTPRPKRIRARTVARDGTSAPGKDTG
jgi:hypothetical protein